MQLEGVVKNIMQIASNKTQTQASSKISLPDTNLTVGELAQTLSILAQEYKTTLPNLVRRLDSVSGNLDHLDRIYTQNDEKVCWSEEEDELLRNGREGLLIRWKGNEAVELRKRYINIKIK